LHVGLVDVDCNGRGGRITGRCARRVQLGQLPEERLESQAQLCARVSRGGGEAGDEYGESSLLIGERCWW